MTEKIQIRSLAKTFPLDGKPFTALSAVDLDIADGEFVTVVGPSGCGKTTLMNILAGLETPSSGEVLVDGQPVVGPSPERGVIFQQYALFPWLTVRKNIEFGLRIAGVRGTELRQRAQHYIDLLGLASHADQLPKALSGGMKQRCAIGRAYAADPKLLLMDEPFGALDAMTRVTLQDQLLETWDREKRTIVFITHDVEEAVYLASRVVVMAARPGRIAEIIPVELPYPRNEETRLSAEFTEIKNRVWRGVHHQSAALTPTA